MDKFDVLAAEAEAGGIAVSVIANGNATDIELLPIAPHGYGAEKVASLARQWAARQLRFIGTIALVNGGTRIAFIEPLEERTLELLASAFTEHCRTMIGDSRVVEIDRRLKEDEVEWLTKLWSLPDTRST